MSKKTVRTILPFAPSVYDPRYMNQLIGALNFFIDDQINPTINLPDVPPDGQANSLVLGDLYEAGGFLKVVRQGDIFSGTFVGETAINGVSVSANADVAAATNVSDALVGTVTVSIT
jgi:hypothetical protein